MGHVSAGLPFRRDFSSVRAGTGDSAAPGTAPPAYADGEAPKRPLRAAADSKSGGKRGARGETRGRRGRRLSGTGPTTGRAGQGSVRGNVQGIVQGNVRGNG